MGIAVKNRPKQMSVESGTMDADPVDVFARELSHFPGRLLIDSGRSSAAGNNDKPETFVDIPNKQRFKFFQKARINRFRNDERAAY